MTQYSISQIFAGLAIAAIASTASQAATVTLAGADGFETSSFSSGLNWSDASAPSAGNDYVVSISRLRTAHAGTTDVTFGGDSLTIATGGEFTFKGASNTGTVTVDNLILDGGLINNLTGYADIFKIAGSLTVASDSEISPSQGEVEIYATISGDGTILVARSDDVAGRALTFYATDNTYTGSIELTNTGRFALADDSNFNFVIGEAGVSNTITGADTGTQVTLDGDLILDLTGASTTLGDSWDLVSATTVTYGDTFTIAGFTETDGVWTDGVYEFDETTGGLTVVPEPASLGLLALSGLAIASRRRRA